MAILLWVGLVWLRRARARLAMLGLAILSVVTLSARAFDLRLTSWILQGFTAVVVLVLVVVFQDDLRRGLEQIAVWGAAPPAETAAGRRVDALVGAARPPGARASRRARS